MEQGHAHRAPASIRTRRIRSSAASTENAGVLTSLNSSWRRFEEPESHPLPTALLAQRRRGELQKVRQIISLIPTAFSRRDAETQRVTTEPSTDHGAHPNCRFLAEARSRGGKPNLKSDIQNTSWDHLLLGSDSNRCWSRPGLAVLCASAQVWYCVLAKHLECLLPR